MSLETLDEVELLKRFFGLNQYEAKAYIALLKKPMARGEISEAAGIPKPRVYDVTRSLEAKGFLRNVGGVYHAVSPEVALPARRAAFRAEFEELDAKRRRAQELLVSSLKAQGDQAPKEPTIVRGLNQIVGLLYQIIPQTSEVYLTINKALEARAVFRSVVMDAVGVGRRLKIFALLPSDAKLEEEDLELIDQLGANVRLAAGVLLDILVTDRDDVLIGLPDPASTESVPVVGAYVRDHAFATSLRETFKKAWSSATPLKT